MKKLTKKAIKEAANYMVMIDWKAAYRNDLSYEALTAETTIEAMDEASELFNDNVYLLAIFEKTGETTDDNGLLYKEILSGRTANRWQTMKAEGYTEGATLGRYISEYGEASMILTCSK